MRRRIMTTSRMKTARTNDNLPQIETIEMVWPHVKEGSGGCHQEDAKYELKEKKGRPKKR